LSCIQARPDYAQTNQKTLSSCEEAQVGSNYSVLRDLARRTDASNTQKLLEEQAEDQQLLEQRIREVSYLLHANHVVTQTCFSRLTIEAQCTQMEAAAEGRDAEMDVVESELRLTIIQLQAEAESMRQQLHAKVEVQASLEDRIADLNAALHKAVCICVAVCLSVGLSVCDRACIRAMCLGLSLSHVRACSDGNELLPVCVCVCARA